MKLFWFVFISASCNGFVPLDFHRFALVRRSSIFISRRTTASRLGSTTRECWEPGNFDNDARDLKRAVAKLNARTSLEETERIRLLEAIANQKRQLLPDLKKLLLVLLAAISCSSIYILFGSSSKLISILLSIPVQTMNIFFAVFNVHIPIISFFIARSTYRPKPRRKNEFEAEFIDLSEDCSNFSLCLLEAWMTVVWPSFLLIWFSAALRWISSDHRINLVWHLGISISQLLTRVGTAIAIHQFPILLHRLRNSRKYGPIQLLPFVVQFLVHTTMNTLALGFVMDLTLVASTFSLMRNLPTKPTTSLISSRQTAILAILLMLSFLSNFIHFVAFKKLFRIGRYSNIPLIQNVCPEDIDATVKLRYRLHWREPKRIFPSFKRSVRNFTKFIFSGWGEDFAIKVENAHLPHILRLVDKESEMGDVPPKNRHLWISNASKAVAKTHKENYRNKSFHDPLGIALYKTFGLGMSMDFDHTSPLDQNEEPSIHRLRARAAKSAIQFYNNIPDIVASEYEAISDPKLKESIIRKETRKRRVQLKSDVYNLMLMLPSNAPAPEGKELEVLTMKRSDLKSVQLNESLPPGLQNNEHNDEDVRKKKSFIDPYLNDEIFDDTVFV